MLRSTKTLSSVQVELFGHRTNHHDVCGQGTKCLILGDQQYFVWDTTSQSTKWIDILKIWGYGSLVSTGYAYVSGSYRQF